MNERSEVLSNVSVSYEHLSKREAEYFLLVELERSAEAFAEEVTGQTQEDWTAYSLEGLQVSEEEEVEYSQASLVGLNGGRVWYRHNGMEVW